MRPNWANWPRLSSLYYIQFILNAAEQVAVVHKISSINLHRPQPPKHCTFDTMSVPCHAKRDSRLRNNYFPQLLINPNQQLRAVRLVVRPCTCFLLQVTGAQCDTRPGLSEEPSSKHLPASLTAQPSTGRVHTRIHGDSRGTYPEILTTRFYGAMRCVCVLCGGAVCGEWCRVCDVWCVVCGVGCVMCGVWCGVWCVVCVCVCVLLRCVVCLVWCGVVRCSAVRCGVVWCVCVWCVVCGVCGLSVHVCVCGCVW